MDQTGLMLKLARELYGEKFSTDEEAKSPLRAAINGHRTELLKLVKQANKSRDIDLILKMERAFLVNDLTLYGNSNEMKGSLSEAVKGVNQTQMLLEMMRNPDKSHYETVNQTLGIASSRTRDGMPKDDGRKFFPGQVMRLRNMDKSRLSVEEKKIITARQEMLRTAEKAYKFLQHKALGVAPQASSKSRDKSHGLEM